MLLAGNAWVIFGIIFHLSHEKDTTVSKKVCEGIFQMEAVLMIATL